MTTLTAPQWRDRINGAMADTFAHGDRLTEEQRAAMSELLAEAERALDDLRDDQDARALDDLLIASRHELWGGAGPSWLAGPRERFFRLGRDNLSEEMADEAILAGFVQLYQQDPGGFEAGLDRLRKEEGATLTEVASVRRAIKGAAKIKAQKEQQAQQIPLEDDGLPLIVVNDRPIRDVSDDAKQAIEQSNEPPVLYRRGGGLARPITDEQDRLRIGEVREAEMLGRLARVANTIRAQANGPKHVTPPQDLVADLRQRDDWKLPALDGIVEAPRLRPDGSVLSTPGYDPATRLIHAPEPGLTVPEIPATPTRKQTAAAASLIEEFFGEFPYEEASGYAAFVALLLTPIVRPAIPGPVPLCAITARQAGTGKTLLANAVSLISTGRPAAMTPAPEREEEWQKTITTLLYEGSESIVIDNIHGTLRSSALDLALSATTYRGRLLGSSQAPSLPQRATWIATANNLKIAGDLPRRTYWIRLDAQVSRPWQRDGFRRHPLETHILSERGHLLAALLTLARAWWAAGQPPADARPLGGFESWATTLAGILAHAEIPGFLADADRHYEEQDEEAAEWETFLRAWHQEYRDTPQLAGRVAQAIILDDRETFQGTLPSDLADHVGARAGTFVRKLGKALAAHEGRRHGDDGLHVKRAGKDSSGRVLWRVTTDPLTEARA